MYRRSIACVNGAATGWPRKAWRARPCGRSRATCVNGAATGWPRKGSKAEWPSRTVRCVNGAATGWPRKEALHCALNGRLPASMGPRPDGRGRLERSATCRLGTVCVNGAATGWPRKAAQQNPAYTAGKLRQWGRDRMAAEGNIGSTLNARLDKRQWGRDRMAAEGRHALGFQRRAWQRQWGRDRMAAEGAHSSPRPAAGGRRQWGRDRMAAEGFRNEYRVGIPRPGVNGAATGWPRKEHRRRFVNLLRCRVNGAATGWPRKAAKGFPQITLKARVNGAATGWPRKAALTWIARLRTILASMGPRPDGRGREATSDKVLPSSQASMGPRPDGRGRRRASLGGRRCGGRQWGRDRMAAEGGGEGPAPWPGSGVNGAATGWPRKVVRSA